MKGQHLLEQIEKDETEIKRLMELYRHESSSEERQKLIKKVNLLYAGITIQMKLYLCI